MKRKKKMIEKIKIFKEKNEQKFKKTIDKD